MSRAVRRVAVSFALLAISACSVRDAACGRQGASTEATADAVAVAHTGTTAPQKFKVVFLGDSLTAGLGLLTEEAYPLVVQEKFLAEGYQNVEVVNAGISGDTTAGGAQRLEQVLESDTKVLVVALGGNDALRGLPTAQTKDNLVSIIEAAGAKGVAVVLAGMEAPTNLGQDYQTAFHAIYPQLAHDYHQNVTFMPFLLEGVAGHADLNQADGIHPNKAGARIIADTMYPMLRRLVDSMGGGG